MGSQGVTDGGDGRDYDVAKHKRAPGLEVHPNLARELLCPEFCSGVSLTLLAPRAVSEDSGLPTPTVPPGGRGRQDKEDFPMSWTSSQPFTR